MRAIEIDFIYTRGGHPLNRFLRVGPRPTTLRLRLHQPTNSLAQGQFTEKLRAPHNREKARSDLCTVG
jgi:hypothetical protein